MCDVNNNNKIYEFGQNNLRHTFRMCHAHRFDFERVHIYRQIMRLVTINRYPGTIGNYPAIVGDAVLIVRRRMRTRANSRVRIPAYIIPRYTIIGSPSAGHTSQIMSATRIILLISPRSALILINTNPFRKCTVH